ncbi:chromosome segregation protein ScpA [Rothia kristinae]|nr:chromosome segregation protein ScpA [Rothia kristinae]MBE8527407.1 segregation/condensation protein A [Amycolatopsis sp. H6(2020)]KTR55289.1 chromosome segregation protein ScpA [Rothia kristinae]KTR62965.1 chromosome segregation protein ScpA [Rothia kristinae]KTR63543.1 chromosome segregation protein ScpA [Rothia kristinae]
MQAAPAPGAPGDLAAAAADPPEADEAAGVFSVTLENFAGPFEVLLNLIGQRRLDITEVALAEVTDEFIAYVRALRDTGLERALDEASEFLVVAATLLDLKAARLLPAGQVEDEEDIAMLEARDLLFARLLQYKAFKDVSGILAERFDAERSRFARTVPLEPELASALPELVFTASPQDLARLAERALTPRQEDPQEVGTDHLHGARVTVREEAEHLAARLRPGAALSFARLVSDAEDLLVVVVRFLALLEMHRDRVVAFAQETPLGELMVRWVGEDPTWSAVRLAADDYQGAAAVAQSPAGAGAEAGTAEEARP